MKKMSLVATTLLIMGLLLFPACDEEKGNDPLTMMLLYNSKYYLTFDVDLDGDTIVDEHVKMRVKEPFDLISDDHWYQGHFSNHYDNSYISIPETTTGPSTYHGGDSHFYMSYYIGHDDYSSYGDHDFTFNIIQWDGIGGEIYAEFEGELIHEEILEEKIIVSGGKVFSRIRE